MTTNIDRPTLIVVAGPTGSGKTDLSIRLAQHYAAPILSTDSRQMYIGMPIGTAQPTPEQLRSVEHHFIADRMPDREFNCGQYEIEALARLEELFARHRYVVAVGGSGLYIQALCEGMDELPQADDDLRRELHRRLEQEGLQSLVEQLRELDPQCCSTIDLCNPARVMRALEVCLLSGRPCSEQRVGHRRERPFRIVKIGTLIDRPTLYERIDRRVDQMIADGLEQEVESMLPFRNCNALQTVGYRELFAYIDGKCTREEAIELVKRNSRRYAKRQMTWFRRDAEIAWFAPTDTEAIIEYIDRKVLQN
ncbi:MAG: tRNA (adenosine(37)-N6)-dimethylallyltransferase MiaA [Alistipes sp.]|nr:tRNA (adenosine(37)-N6)-dimethylallyltransferase MiaA [Alistipes sp.]